MHFKAKKYKKFFLVSNKLVKCCGWEVRALAMGTEGPKLVRGIFEQLSLFIQEGMGTQLYSELGMVKAVRKRHGTPPQLDHC